MALFPGFNVYSSQTEAVLGRVSIVPGHRIRPAIYDNHSPDPSGVKLLTTAGILQPQRRVSKRN